MSAPLLTVIVPAYNSEDYLDRALTTLVGYGDELETIIVNDGSKDNTAQIADEWAARYPSVRVIHQENKGHGGAAASGVGTALIFALVARLFLRLTRGEIALGAMASSLNNGAYIGIPIAVYVLNDASAVVPILVFQLGFFTPMFFVLADLVGSCQRPSIAGIARVVARNPMVIAAVCGFLFSAVGWPMPTLVDVSTSMLGAAAPPMILLSFGASLVDRRSASGDSGAAATACAIVGKLVVQPAIACGVGILLGLTGPALMSVAIMAALPSAQNAYIAATRARAGERIAQGTVLVTTFASLPVVVGIAAIFHGLGLIP
ncbi:AEC family transporter [Actinomyces bouchesdurhonensis]|uniref:AEC family transporter n=1 Tax=Actinomyces bouchesdurhonensis TaxID=1852361 RepID=UPI00093D8539|nr:AEC family transporter [Actinomyces bouchesdurhonensis]